jgi:hypothetical protein
MVHEIGLPSPVLWFGQSPIVTKNVAPYIPLFATTFLCNLDTYITRPSASLNPYGSHNFIVMSPEHLGYHSCANSIAEQIKVVD